jgi:hypothetical protein
MVEKITLFHVVLTIGCDARYEGVVPCTDATKAALKLLKRNGRDGEEASVVVTYTDDHKRFQKNFSVNNKVTASNQ